MVYLFLCKTLGFLFLPFLSLCTQIRCPQNGYTDLKLALDQLLIKMKWWNVFWKAFKYKNTKNREHNLETFMVNTPHHLYKKIKPAKGHREEMQIRLQNNYRSSSIDWRWYNFVPLKFFTFGHNDQQCEF